jgi:hypothetical protein
MLRIRLLSSPPAIAIDGEPLGGVDRVDWPPVATEGFELMPTWHARPAHGRRGVLATLPVLAVAAAAALSIGRGHDPTPLSAGPLRPAWPARPALVVKASPAPATDISSARR